MGCRVISPLDLNFVHDVDGFVVAAHELDDEPGEIEGRHLNAIALADFVWLHASDGYVGRSASMEIGFANALGMPIFSSSAPEDVSLASLVHVVASPSEAIDALQLERLKGVGRPLRVLQSYYRAVALDRGYESETPQDVMLLITEELGELARAIRRSVGLTREGGFSDEDAAQELADVQLYLVHLANALGVDLADAVSTKETANADRHAASRREMTAPIREETDEARETVSA